MHLKNKLMPNLSNLPENYFYDIDVCTYMTKCTLHTNASDDVDPLY